MRQCWIVICTDWNRPTQSVHRAFDTREAAIDFIEDPNTPYIDPVLIPGERP